MHIRLRFRVHVVTYPKTTGEELKRPILDEFFRGLFATC